MTKSKIVLTAAILASLSQFSQAEPYQLDWKHRSVPVEVESSNAPAALPGLEELINPNSIRLSPSVSQTAKEKPAQLKPVTIQVYQSYDHYKQRYRTVSRVETIVYAGGYPREEVHCNRASYTSYTVKLDELKLGDRFQVRVTWDDGSDHSVEKNVTEWTASTLVIDEPLAFDDAFDS